MITKKQTAKQRFCLILIMSIFTACSLSAQPQDTVYRKGYLFFKYEKNDLPYQAIFVEKDFRPDDFIRPFSDRVNVLTDTGTFFLLRFLEKPDGLSDLFKHTLDVRLWSNISVSEDDKINTYQYEMRVVPVLLQVIFLQGRFTEFNNDSFQYTILSETGPVLKNCRHQSQSFGIVRRIYRSFYY